MRALIIGIFVLGIFTGAISFDFKSSDFVRHECNAAGKGTITFLSAFNVEDPLSENTCGDMHAIHGLS